MVYHVCESVRAHAPESVCLFEHVCVFHCVHTPVHDCVCAYEALFAPEDVLQYTSLAVCERHSCACKAVFEHTRVCVAAYGCARAFACVHLRASETHFSVAILLN